MEEDNTNNDQSDINESHSYISDGAGANMIDDDDDEMDYAPVERMRGTGKRGARKKCFLKEDCKSTYTLFA